MSLNGKVVASEGAGEKSLTTCPNRKEFYPGHAPVQALGVEFEQVMLEASPWKGSGLQRSPLLLRRTWTTLEIGQFLVHAGRWV